jgi:outer membrane autotransporter protein
VFQIGGNIVAGSLTEHDRLHIGLTCGYAKQDITTRNPLSEYRSNGKMEGYNAGFLVFGSRIHRNVKVLILMAGFYTTGSTIPYRENSWSAKIPQSWH